MKKTSFCTLPTATKVSMVCEAACHPWVGGPFSNKSKGSPVSSSHPQPALCSSVPFPFWKTNTILPCQDLQFAMFKTLFALAHSGWGWGGQG